jgi:importin-7
MFSCSCLPSFTSYSNVFAELQQEQPQYYASLTAHLTVEEQAIITSVFQQADIIAQQAASAPNGSS